MPERKELEVHATEALARVSAERTALALSRAITLGSTVARLRTTLPGPHAEQVSRLMKDAQLVMHGEIMLAENELKSTLDVIASLSNR